MKEKNKQNDFEVIVPLDKDGDPIVFEHTREEKWNKLLSNDSNGYISFTIARYALTDVIEELHNSNAKDIIVTKEDDNLVVKYKPDWRK